MLAGGEGDADFGVVEEPAGDVVDGGFVAEGGFCGDDEVYGVAGFVVSGVVVEVAVEAHGGDEAIGAWVDVDVDDDGVAWGDVAGLFADGEEEVFIETPVEPRADAWGVVGDLEACELAGHDEGRAGGGDGTAFGVEVEEDFEFVAGGGVLGWGVGWEEDLAEAAAVEEETVGG